MKEFKIIGLDTDKLLIENPDGAKFYATLDWFAENFTITEKEGLKTQIISCGYVPKINEALQQTD